MNDSIIDKLSDCGAATVHEALGRRGALSAQMRPIPGTTRVKGRALTVRARAGDNLALHLALLQVEPGDVLVVEADGYTEAGAWGDILTAAAQRMGVSGLVIDGSVRDVATIAKAGFPVFSKGISMKGTTKSDPGDIGAPVTIDGVTVSTGDVIIGDLDGVVVIPSDAVDETAEAAENRMAIEEQYFAGLAEGRTTVELLGLTVPDRESVR